MPDLEELREALLITGSTGGVREFDGIDFGSPGYLHTVPEPSTWLLLALAGLGFAARQRMRRG